MATAEKVTPPPGGKEMGRTATLHEDPVHMFIPDTPYPDTIVMPLQNNSAMQNIFFHDLTWMYLSPPPFSFFLLFSFCSLPNPLGPIVSPQKSERVLSDPSKKEMLFSIL